MKTNPLYWLAMFVLLTLIMPVGVVTQIHREPGRSTSEVSWIPRSIAVISEDEVFVERVLSRISIAVRAGLEENLSGYDVVVLHSSAYAKAAQRMDRLLGYVASGGVLALFDDSELNPLRLFNLNRSVAMNTLTVIPVKHPRNFSCSADYTTCKRLALEMSEMGLETPVSIAMIKGFKLPNGRIGVHYFAANATVDELSELLLRKASVWISRVVEGPRRAEAYTVRLGQPLGTRIVIPVAHALTVIQPAPTNTVSFATPTIAQSWTLIGSYTSPRYYVLRDDGTKVGEVWYTLWFGYSKTTIGSGCDYIITSSGLIQNPSPSKECNLWGVLYDVYVNVYSPYIHPPKTSFLGYQYWIAPTQHIVNITNCPYGYCYQDQHISQMGPLGNYVTCQPVSISFSAVPRELSISITFPQDVSNVGAAIDFDTRAITATDGYGKGAYAEWRWGVGVCSLPVYYPSGTQEFVGGAADGSYYYYSALGGLTYDWIIVGFYMRGAACTPKYVDFCYYTDIFQSFTLYTDHIYAGSPSYSYGRTP